MTIDSLVFSNQPKFRITRHVFFWLGWISYFTMEATLRRSQMYGVRTSFFSSLTEIMGSTPIDMTFCYSIIYFLFPRFLFKGMYIRMVLIWFLFAIAGFFVYHGYNLYVAPHIYDFYGLKRSSGSSSMLWAFFFFFLTFNMEGCMAAAIKLGKMWHIKKRENDVLNYQKEKMQAVISNGNTQSTFLFHTFSRIQQLSQLTSPQLSAMIQRLQKITLFALSQYQQTQVDIGNELQILRELIALEQEGNAGSDYRLEVNGEIAGKKIASFVLLPLVENIFSHVIVKSGSQNFVHISITVNRDLMKCTIRNSKPPETSTLLNDRRDIIYQIKKRLSLLYPGCHQLSVTIETQAVITTLEVDLGALVLY